MNIGDIEKKKLCVRRAALCSKVLNEVGYADVEAYRKIVAHLSIAELKDFVSDMFHRQVSLEKVLSVRIEESMRPFADEKI